MEIWGRCGGEISPPPCACHEGEQQARDCPRLPEIRHRVLPEYLPAIAAWLSERRAEASHAAEASQKWAGLFACARGSSMVSSEVQATLAAEAAHRHL